MRVIRGRRKGEDVIKMINKTITKLRALSCSTGISFCDHMKIRLLTLSGQVNLYQPIKGFTISAKRPGDDRWTLIEPELPIAHGSVIDLGCNLGFFVFRSHNKGFIAHGMDSNPWNIKVARTLSELWNLQGVSFEVARLTPEYAAGIPSYDVVLCLSLIHHIILHQGLDAASQVLLHLRKKTKKVLFFEMGQSDEIGTSWAHKLPPMNPTPEIWIRNWPLDAVFSRVKPLGRSFSYARLVKLHDSAERFKPTRILFRADVKGE